MSVLGSVSIDIYPYFHVFFVDGVIFVEKKVRFTRANRAKKEGRKNVSMGDDVNFVRP